MNTDKLVILREFFNLSQEKFAEKIDVTRQTVYKWECGLSLPTHKNIQNICAVLGVDERFFYSENSDVRSFLISKENPDALSDEYCAYDIEQPTAYVCSSEGESVDLSAYRTPPPKKVNKTKYIILNILFFVITLVLAIATYIIGGISMPKNTGAAYTITIYIDKSVFYIALAVDALWLAFETYFIIHTIRIIGR